MVRRSQLAQLAAWQKRAKWLPFLCADGSDEICPQRRLREFEGLDDQAIFKMEQAELASVMNHSQVLKTQKSENLEEHFAREAEKALQKAERDGKECRNAEQGTECFNHVLYAMSHGIYQHPNWYPGLTSKSSFGDFQALLHLLPSNECARPCREAGCLRLSVQFACQLRVEWLRQVEFIQHSVWYPELSADSSSEALAMALWQRGDKACSRPCGENEADDPVLLKGLRRPVAQHPAMPAKKSTSASASLSKQSLQACLEHGVYYLPLDMSGFAPRGAEDPMACQLLCAQQAGSAFYSFFTPTRTCHCEAVEVGVRHIGWGFISGSTSCGNVKQHPDTLAIIQHMHNGCFEAGVGYADVLESSWQADSLQCQRRCQSFGERCDHFAFHSLGQSCQLSGPGAARSYIVGVVSGPRSCPVLV